MSELIDRQAALDALGERPTVWTDDDDYALGERNQYDMDRLAIETVPSAQPVEDARAMCGECDAWNKYKNYPQPERFNPCTVCQEFDCTGCKFRRT